MFKFKDHSQIVLIIVSLLLLALNIFLIKQNFQFKKEIEQSKKFVTEEGYKFSELKLKDLNGSEEVVNFSDTKINNLLLVFRPSCDYCVQQYPNWINLLQNIDQKRWRVIAITSETDTEKIKKHLEENNIKGIKIGIMSVEDLGKARLLYTPMTVAVNLNGEVEKVWAGLWKGEFELPN